MRTVACLNGAALWLAVVSPVLCAVIARVRLSVCLCICSLLSLHVCVCVCVRRSLQWRTCFLQTISFDRSLYRSADLADASSIAVSQASHDQSVSVHFSHSCVRLMNVNTRVIDYETDFIHSLNPRPIQTHWSWSDDSDVHEIHQIIFGPLLIVEKRANGVFLCISVILIWIELVNYSLETHSGSFCVDQFVSVVLPPLSYD